MEACHPWNQIPPQLHLRLGGFYCMPDINSWLDLREGNRLREEQGLDLNTLVPWILFDFFQILDKLKPLPELGSGKACGFKRNSGQPF